MSTKFFTIDIW